ncbi:MerR family transcriptional regulator [Thermococcus sp.]|uniref:MerR family transcriptional regulator n=1 Tax=Thermococcus sp. TaxID=35749 RepID=UPI002620D0A3|nr:MerR family transcriptional regulator [Thermococcus sp.]MCD6143668.1 MerR family transcriptional regulator [Thermococcus sp.]MCD6143679.1 MerR family transcriptional regulator [Thermococcus sp.]
MKEVIILTIRELARVINMPYSTTRKYVKALEDRGLIHMVRTDHGYQLGDHAVEMVKQLKALVESGISLNQALDQLAGSKDNIMALLQRMDQKINNLEKENRALRELVQVLMAKIDQLPALEPPKKPWWKRIFKR